jgi:hypothetical protein
MRSICCTQILSFASLANCLKFLDALLVLGGEDGLLRRRGLVRGERGDEQEGERGGRRGYGA